MASQRSLINKENKRGPKIDPCGTSLRIGKYPDRTPPAQTHWKRPESRARKTIYSPQFQTEKRMNHRGKHFRKIKQHQSNKKSLVQQPVNVVGNIKFISFPRFSSDFSFLFYSTENNFYYLNKLINLIKFSSIS
jgi:hypothetical protein